MKRIHVMKKIIALFEEMHIYYTRDECRKEILSTACILLILGWICFRSVLACVLSLLFLPMGLRYRLEEKKHDRLMQLQKEFRAVMASLYSLTASGSTLEKAVRDSYVQMTQMRQQYPLLLPEFEKMCIAMDRNMRAEQVLYDFALKTGIGEIIQFSEILAIAAKSGGALSEIVRSAADAMSLRMEINEEIDTMLSGRKGEFTVMLVVPLGILVYMNLCSADYMAVLYCTLAGRLTVLLSIAAYILAVKIGQKILDIRV